MKPFNPKSTVFTNEMLDEIMPITPPNAWKVLCLAMRKTAGWQDLSTLSGRKESDVISISQFMKGCGIQSENTVMEAIDFCLNKGYLLREQEGQSFRYRLNTEYELTSSEIEEVALTTSSEIEEVASSKIEETNSNINIKDHAREQNIKEANKRALERGLMNKNIPHLSEYPEDVRHVLEKFFLLWNIALPPRKSGQYGYWLKGARELIIACDGHIDVVLDNIQADLKTRKRGYTITIASPNSLVQMARAKVGELKTKLENKDKPVIPVGAAEVWIGGVKYG